MTESPNIAALAAHLADPARARMVLALMDGRALTVSELAAVAGLSKAGASTHLTRLLDAGLLRADRQGRHKYLALANAPVARLVESLMAVAVEIRGAGAGGAAPLFPTTGPRDPALREARLCYNHLAGAMGVQLYQSLSGRGFLAHTPGGLTLTPAGHAFALAFGLTPTDLTPTDLAPARTPLCRDCLDWSERQSHLGGRLGRLLLERTLALGWLRRQPASQPSSRALLISPIGRAAFAKTFPRPAQSLVQSPGFTLDAALLSP